MHPSRTELQHTSTTRNVSEQGACAHSLPCPGGGSRPSPQQPRDALGTAGGAVFQKEHQGDERVHRTTTRVVTDKGSTKEMKQCIEQHLVWPFRYLVREQPPPRRVRPGTGTPHTREWRIIITNQAQSNHKHLVWSFSTCPEWNIVIMNKVDSKHASFGHSVRVQNGKSSSCTRFNPHTKMLMIG